MCDRPDADDLPHKTWECRRCGALNSDLAFACEWCDPEQDRADWLRDHDRDIRKHGR
jgi:hypothetical protein